LSDSAEHILSIRGLAVSYGGVQAVRGVTLDVVPGEIVGVVGESGSGKSTVLRAVAGLLGRSGAISGGSVLYGGRELVGLSRRDAAKLRGSDIAYVFQDPVASLDPLCRIGKQFDECIWAHGVASGAAVRELERGLLAEMGFGDPERVLRAYPHNLSGGMCQRVVLAMSVACDPALLLADEPTSALDVTSQQQVSQLLLRIRDQRSCAMLVVSHNIAAIAQVADRIGVMKGGCLVELGERDQVLYRPTHPYTRELIAAVPRAPQSEGGGNDAS
jgi:ABC-type glutathione transport system ATPase component